MAKPPGKEKVSAEDTPAGQESHTEEALPLRERLHTKALVITLIPISVLVIVSFAVYFNALSGEFVYDDKYQIVDNPWIRDIQNIPRIFSESVWGFQPRVVTSNYYRPLMHLVYMFNYHVFGLKPWGFHLVNVLFHCGASVLVFLIFRELLSQYGVTMPPARSSPPLIAALLFASHPGHTEAVTWIAGLPDVAFTFFYLLSFSLYCRSKSTQSVSFLFSIVCFALSALFKEPALTLPVILFAYDRLFPQRRARLLENTKRYLPFLVVGACYLALRMHALGEFAPKKKHVTLSGCQYVINVFPLFTQYVEKLFFPINLSAFYVFHPLSSLLEPKGFFSLFAALAFVIVLAVAVRRNRLISLALLFVILPLLPVLYIPALGENTFTDRYLYLPSVGYVFLLGLFWAWSREKLPQMAKGITVVFLVVMTSYATGTVTRNYVWKDGFALWSDTVRKSPDSAEAHLDLGVAYKAKGFLDLAITEYQTALSLNSFNAEAHNDLGNAYADKGLLALAVTEYQTALFLNPNYTEAHNNLGTIYMFQGLLDAAIEQYRIALRLKPDFAEPHFNLGLIYLNNGSIAMAKAELEAGLAIRPDDYRARQLLDKINSQ